MAAVAHAPLVVTHEGGARFAADIRGHWLVVDQPAPVGGDEAPQPIELLGAALGTCIALYVQQFCQARSIDYQGMRVEVATHGAKQPSRIGQFEVKVVLPAGIDPHWGEMLERVARSCPAHNTLVHGAEVSVAIEAGVPAHS